jgi:hypothetical protein
VVTIKTERVATIKVTEETTIKATMEDQGEVTKTTTKAAAVTAEAVMEARDRFYEALFPPKKIKTISHPNTTDTTYVCML